MTVTAEPEPTIEEEPEPEPEPEPEFDYADLSPELSLKTTDKQCFGSAGCNVSVEVEIGVNDPDSIPEDATGSITYEITGGEDGPIIGTFELEGDGYDTPTENFSTESNGTEYEIEITNIETD